MSSLSERVWFGTARRHGDGEPMDLGRPLVVGLIFVGLIVLRLLLPFRDHSSMMVYNQIVWALLNDVNFGRQALVSVIEYPPVPTVCLLALSSLENLLVSLRLPSPRADYLLVAICQVWSWFYLVRMADLYRSRRWRYLLAGLLMLCLVVGSGAADANPFWVYMVMLCSILFHLCRWEKTHSLRDVVVVALNCGLLIFGGVIGALFGMVVLLTIWLRGNRSVVHQPGGSMLLWLPTLYALLLYPLFNWLIMEDPLFWIKRFVEQFQTRQLAVLLISDNLHILLLLSVLAVGMMLLPKVPLYTRVGINLALACALAATLRHEAMVYLGGEYLFIGFALIPLLLIFLYHEDTATVPSLGLMVICTLVIAACVQFRGSARSYEHFAINPPAPSGRQILQKVDELWPRGRVLLFDLRSAAIYVPNHPDRFVAQLDYSEATLYDRIQHEPEQFHLLVPPNNGQFYSRSRSPLAKIHSYKPQSWLLLEQTWPGGWLLFTCISPPSQTAP